jgi:hypothetical protein
VLGRARCCGCRPQRRGHFSKEKPNGRRTAAAAKHKAFHGLCLAVIQAARTPGEIRLSATAQGLQSEPVAIITVSPAAER